MKYTKKVPYFKKGDKVDKVDKALRKLPKKQKEAILKISSAQKEQERKDKLSSVGAGFKKPTAKVTAPADTRSAQIENTVGKKAAKTRGQAFQQARARGDSEFLWQGKRYHTRTAEEEAERRAAAGKTSKDKTSKDKTSKDKTSKDKTSTEVEQSFLPGITRPVTSRYGYITQGPAAESITNRQQHSIDVSRLPEIGEETEPVKTGRTYINDAGEEKPIIANRFIWPSGLDNTFLATEDGERIFERDIYQGDTTYVAHGVEPTKAVWDFYKKALANGDKVIWESRGYQQGGTINKFQRGSKIVGEKKPSWFGQLKEKYSNFITGAQTSSNARDQEDFNNLMNLQFRESQKQQWDAEIKSDIIKMMRGAAQQQRDSYDTRETFESKWMRPVETQPTPGTGYGIGRSSIQKNGGTIDKFQRGNVLTNREQHLVDVSRLPKLSIPQVWSRKLFGTGPKPVETGRTHLNKSGKQVPEVGNRIIMPGGRDNTTITRGTNYGSGWLTSQRNIQKGDTTYLTPGGNAPSAADLPRYKRVFDNADKKIWKSRGYQQGGQVEQQPQITEEDLIMDFTVRYLSALGVSPEEIMDQEGSLNPAYVEEITNVFQQGDIDWESYMASPDEYIQQFVGSRMQMAKKGAKLKRLSQLRIHKK